MREALSTSNANMLSNHLGPSLIIFCARAHDIAKLLDESPSKARSSSSNSAGWLVAMTASSASASARLLSASSTWTSTTTASFDWFPASFVSSVLEPVVESRVGIDLLPVVEELLIV